MARFPRPRVTEHLPMIGGGLVAVLAAGVVLMLPSGQIETIVEATGLPALLPMAAPPLGGTARALLAIVAGLGFGAVIWSVLFLLFGPGGVIAAGLRGEEDAPIIRRADAHPDAPPRWPLSAAELGVPPRNAVEKDEMEARPVPADLDQRLAAFDPNAIPAVPRSPVPPVAPLTPRERTERTETVALAPMVRSQVRPPEPAPVREPSIESLLQRLERGTRRRSVIQGG